jgi:exopolysaccharide biosynthesis polyprenyl glycosylphosphotransferase
MAAASAVAAQNKVARSIRFLSQVRGCRNDSEPFEQGWQMDAEWGKSSIRRDASESDSLRKRGGRGILRARFIATLMSIDLLSIICGFTLAHVLVGRDLYDTEWLPYLLAITPIFLVLAINLRAYDIISLNSRFVAVKTASKALLITLATIVLVAFCLKVSANFSRLTMIVGMLVSMVLVAMGRYVFVGRAERILGGKAHISILMVDGDHTVPSGDHMLLYPVDHDIDPDEHDPHMYDRLAKALGSADRVIVSCAPERRQSWARALKGANIRSEIIVPELAALAPLGQGRLEETPTVVVANGPLRLTDRLIKRAFDIFVAGTALVLLLPALVLTAILIKLESPGPVFFVQTRIGRGNEQFRLFKFRSMRHEKSDSQGRQSAARDDDRITRVGRVLRMTSVDELPQLLNVLMGDMSIVGPRPHALGSRAADKLFWEIDERYWHRHTTKPGLTGLAQVRGYRGATQSESDLINRLQADLEYLDHWSLLKDVWILFRTVRVILHPNAY